MATSSTSSSLLPSSPPPPGAVVMALSLSVGGVGAGGEELQEKEEDNLEASILEYAEYNRVVWKCNSASVCVPTSGSRASAGDWELEEKLQYFWYTRLKKH